MPVISKRLHAGPSSGPIQLLSIFLASGVLLALSGCASPGTLAGRSVAPEAPEPPQVGGPWNERDGTIWHSGGPVGVGTASPTHQLHLRAEETGGGLLIETTNAHPGPDPGVALCKLTDSGQGPRGYWMGTRAHLDQRFDIADITESKCAGAGTVRLTIDREGQVGIGTTSPQAGLHVANGGIRIGAHALASQITVCSYDDPAFSNSPGPNHYAWKGSDCDNGLPQGSCMGFVGKAFATGQDHDWEVLLPGERQSGGGPGPFPTGAMAWWMGADAGNEVHLRATYFCS